MNDLIGCNNNMTSVDEYKPTASEEKMLEILLNPENTGKNITEKCQLAGVSRETWYKAFRKPEFVKLVNESAIDLVKDKVADLINATFKFAVSTPQNHQDRRILLEMAGLYREKQDINLNPDDPLKAQIMQMTDADLMRKIQEFVKDNPEIVENMKQEST